MKIAQASNSIRAAKMANSFGLMALTGQPAQHHHDQHADDQAGRLDQQRE